MKSHRLMTNYSVKDMVSIDCECGWKSRECSQSKDGHYMSLCDGAKHLENELATAKQVIDAAQRDFGYVPLLAL